MILDCVRLVMLSVERSAGPLHLMKTRNYEVKIKISSFERSFKKKKDGVG